MARLFTYSALILRVRSVGEANRDAWFLSAEEGILRATVFGGPKSKLRAYVEPYHRGDLWVYRDPVRDSRKVTDFDVQSWKPGIREAYIRSAAASAIAETVLATHGGGGNWAEAFKLVDASLEALDSADDPCCARIFIHFLWNWAEFLGVRPDPEARDNACDPPENGVPWNKPGPGALGWLRAVQDLSPVQLTRYTLDESSARQARGFVTAVMADALGKRLGTWDF
ncbi:putative recombination protein O [Treponema primitia ZAS-2]|uniref:Putative recombination protein O n=1 Tax=Treponema primitia (strain ATCC BAA-887 / DSM 12427 / ZAS-2) TaxID=545694 RepID=F5YHR9_TREPZ|nr:recombination protein O N-terminal domain-containing protein [Treponema primitia]AEF85558.1 putative recombination protein O [Treponema primitia ZAS-2]